MFSNPEPPPSFVPDAKTMIFVRIDDSVYIGMMPFMRKFGTPLKRSAIKILLLGSGELGREVAIEAMRLGVEVIACDRYKNAPAMQMAHRNYTFNMREGKNIRKIVEKEKPDFIVPEIEAIATDTLVELEKEGWTVIPRAIATKLTMDREGIRRLSAEKLKLPTSPYHFASSLKELEKGALDVGFPCVIKTTMSSSGHGQSVARKSADLKKAWHFAMTDTRVKTGRVIVEGFIDFDYEITLLTVLHAKGISYCAPVGHRQVNGDKVWFSEVSPRPHDAGMVTMVSQTMSEMELHVRAILDLPIPGMPCVPGASYAILAHGNMKNPTYEGVSDALKIPGTHIRIFGKPEVIGHRRMGVALAIGKTVAEARKKAMAAAKKVKIIEG